MSAGCRSAEVPCGSSKTGTFRFPNEPKEVAHDDSYDGGDRFPHLVGDGSRADDLRNMIKTWAANQWR